MSPPTLTTRPDGPVACPNRAAAAADGRDRPIDTGYLPLMLLMPTGDTCLFELPLVQE
jgi:hypothetical protein